MFIKRFGGIVFVSLIGISFLTGKAMADIYFNDSGSLIRVGNNHYELSLSKKNGAVNSMKDKKTGLDVVLPSPDGILWEVGVPVLAKSNQMEKFGYTWSPKDYKLVLVYDSTDLTIKVNWTFSEKNYFEGNISLEKRGNGAVNAVFFPSDINFSINRLNQFIYPFNVGMALQPGFFKEIEERGSYQENLTEFKPCTENYSYPGPLFSDFVSIDSKDGQVSIYLIQDKPIMQTAWLKVGANEKRKGFGRYSHQFDAYIRPNSSWQSSPVRFEIGSKTEEALRSYASLNKTDKSRTLREKLGEEKFNKLANSVFIHYNLCDGYNRLEPSFAKLDSISASLPSPCLIHYVPPVHNYPELPPGDPRGKLQDFRNFLANSRGRGQLVMPFTVWTWINTESPGLKEIELKEYGCWNNEEADLSKDTWSLPSGSFLFMMTSPHSPSLRRVLHETVLKYRKDYQIDFLFEDAIGATCNQYDFNPASPQPPLAYFQGLVDIASSHSKIIPLMTEKGFDLLTPIEAGFCGLDWGLFKGGERTYEMRLRFGDYFTEDYWRIYPLAQYLSHPYIAFYEHNLAGNDITKHDVSMALILGYNLMKATHFDNCWMKIDDSIQKAVCSRYFGKRLTAFKHLTSKVIKAEYEDIEIIANLNDRETYQVDSETTIAREGFLAKSKDGTLFSGIFRKFNGIEYDFDLLLIKEKEDRNIRLQVFTLDSLKPLKIRLKELETLVDITPEIYPKEDIVKPPAEREKPEYIGVINFPDYDRVDIPIAEWLEALNNSSLVKEGKVQVREITSIDKLYDICETKDRDYLMIINPYGGSFPIRGMDSWRESIKEVRDYIKNGGVWWETGGNWDGTGSLPADFLIYQEGNSFHRKERTFVTGISELLRADIGASVFGARDCPAEIGEREKPHPQPVHLTPSGKEWLGDNFEKEIADEFVIADSRIPGTATVERTILLSTKYLFEVVPYISAYQVNGWGWLFRVEGQPNENIVLKVVPEVAEYLYSQPPVLLPFKGAGYREILLECE